MKKPVVKVAIVEDDRRFREGLVETLRTTTELTCTAVCESGRQALMQIPELQPDVVLMDLDLGCGPNGLDVLSNLIRELPETAFLVLTVQDDAKAIFEAARRGAVGYLRKSISIAELPAAIMKVHRGERIFSQDVLRIMWDAFQNPPPSSAELEKLSPRETEILDLLAQGFQPKEVASRFDLSIETVKTHIRNIHKKLCVSTTQQAVKKVYPSKRFSLWPRWIRGGQPL